MSPEDLPSSLDSGSGTGEAAPCDDQYPLPFPESGFFDAVLEPDVASGYVVDVDVVCPEIASTHGVTADLFAYIYRPAEPGATDWPSYPTPFIVFVSGVGINVVAEGEQTYDYLFAELARNGFTVVAVQIPNVIWNELARQGAMLCAVAWVRNPGDFGWPESANQRLNCDLTLMGHSRGAMAVQNTIAQVTIEEPDLRFAAAVSIATAADLSVGRSGIVDVVSSERAVPILFLQGGNDEDPSGDAILAADRYTPEEAIGTPSPVDEVLLWAYDVPHRAWGGRSSTDQAEDYEDRQIVKAEAIAATYIPAFLRWQIYGETTWRSLFVAPARHDSAASDFPPSVAVPELWSYLSPQFADLGDRPVLLEGVAIGVDGASADRLVVDTMLRETDVPCGAPAQPDILTPSSAGFAVLADGFGPEDLCLQEASGLTVFDKHEGHVMLLEWGSVPPGSFVRWMIGQDLSSYSVLTFRVGKVRRVGTGSEDETMSIIVDVSTSTGTESITYDRLIAQDDHWDGSLGLNPPETDFMHTVRIPLSDFCALGADPASVTSISIRVPSGQPPGEAIIFDSIVLTRHPEDAAHLCP